MTANHIFSYLEGRFKVNMYSGTEQPASLMILAMLLPEQKKHITMEQTRVYIYRTTENMNHKTTKSKVRSS